MDPTLGFRYACRVGMCGSCAMVVNGKDRWTCRTLVRSLGVGSITLEPLRNMPVIRDLAVDFQPLWQKYRHIQPAFEPGDPKRFLKAESRRKRQQIEPNLQCISCGICYSACGYVATDPLYLGPHALNRAFTVIEDPRDGAGEARLRLVDDEHGCWKCHVQTNCTETCPMELSPSAGIQSLKRAILQRRLLTPSRRRFVFAAVGAAISVAAAYVAYQPREWVSVGPLESIPTETFFAFQDDDKRAFLRRSATGEVTAFSQRCSHQGCQTAWNATSSEFLCACHGGVFDRAGLPLAGPPVRELERFETRVENGVVSVLI
jgi:fumarate reductase iron-sulfur subunit